MVNFPDLSQITLWPDCGNNVRSAAGAKAEGASAFCFKIAEGRGNIDPAGRQHHDDAMGHGLLPIAYTFPLPDICGMTVEDQAKRDLDLMHQYHGGFDGIGLMLDLEFQPPDGSGWGGWTMSALDARRYRAQVRAEVPPLPAGGYLGSGYGSDGQEGFDWTVVPSYVIAGLTPYPVDWILENAPGVPPGVTARPKGGATARQFTDCGNDNGLPTDWNIAWMPPAAFIAKVIHGTHPQPPGPVNPLGPHHYDAEPLIVAGATDMTWPVGIHPVKDWQQGLNIVYSAGLGVDGKFGPATLAATIRFQTAGIGGSLKGDGEVGRQTWTKLGTLRGWQGL